MHQRCHDQRRAPTWPAGSPTATAAAPRPRPSRGCPDPPASVCSRANACSGERPITGTSESSSVLTRTAAAARSRRRPRRAPRPARSPIPRARRSRAPPAAATPSSAPARSGAGRDRAAARRCRHGSRRRPTAPLRASLSQASGSLAESVDGRGTARRLSGNFGRTMSEQTPFRHHPRTVLRPGGRRLRPSPPVVPRRGRRLADRSPARSMVLELGAGTGKLTEVLHRVGHDVLATDPLARHARRLRKRLPAPAVVAARGAHPAALPLGRRRGLRPVLPLVRPRRALAEIARVLRPGGMLALAWNTYDEDIPWVTPAQAADLARQRRQPRDAGSDRR